MEYGSGKLLSLKHHCLPVEMASHSRRLESVQIIISLTFRALAHLNVLQILAGWLILCVLEVMEDANYNPVAGYCDRGLSCFSSGSSGKY
jgi:hypothetical protein